ncbi:MAG: peptidylprolyl isomerase [Burkholderiales bacterium]|jgi:peptidyl-prolyl cis-trans isomerase C|nr:peptidylprolyl isomerase [Burkholderiales bacterium]
MNDRANSAFSERDGAAQLAAVRSLLSARAALLGLEGADEEARIEALLDREVAVPEPTDEECRRFYENHPELFTAGELVAVRHILFAVVPGTPVDALARTAEKALADVRANPDRFADVARQFSNCPSGQHGGNLGQLQRGETVPEFEEAVFGADSTGVLPRLVNTRYGFHVICVDERIAGHRVPFEAVRDQVAANLAERVRAKALVQYVRILAAEAGVDALPLAAVSSPLLQ